MSHGGDDSGVAYSKWLLANAAVVRLQSCWFPIESVSCGSRRSCPLDVLSEELTSGLRDGWRTVKHFLS